MGTRLATATYSALCDELEAGRFESELTRSSVDAGDDYAPLLRACALAETGHFASARADVETALSRAPDNPVVRLAAGMILYVTRDHGRALEELAQGARLSSKARDRALQAIVTRAGRLGWTQDVKRALETALHADPAEPRWRAEALRVATSGRDWEGGLEHALHIVEAHPSAAAVHMEIANLLVRVGRPDEAETFVDTALACADERDVRFLLEAARVLSEAGAFGAAETHLRRARELAPADSAPLEAMATLAAWQGDLGQAFELAREALAHDRSAGGALRVLGTVQLLRGRPAEAISLLDDALAANTRDYEAHAWRAEALLASKRYDETHANLTRASMAAPGFLFSAWLLRLLCNIREEDPAPYLTRRRFEEIYEGLLELVPGCEAALASGRHADAEQVLVAALDAMGGNRGVCTTYVRDGRLHRLRSRTGPRHASRLALELVRSAGPEASLRALTEVTRRFPESSLPLAHRGELKLWLGDLDGSLADLRAAIAVTDRTRWAYIGMTCIETMRGAPKEALKVSQRGVEAMDNTTGPAVHVHRGEALRVLGRHDEAREDLERAIEMHTSRVSAWINLGLLACESDDEQTLARVLDRLLLQAPGLVSDAARSAGVTLVGDPGFEPSRGDAEVMLRRALHMLRGNRSSTCITYFTDDDQLRYVPHYPHRGRGPHDSDSDDLMQARGLLLRAMGVSHGGRRSAPAPKKHAHAFLSDEQRRHFVEKGYVRLRGCFSAKLAEEWIADANWRIRHEPGRWIRGYDPTNPQHDLSAYDPRDPATWSWDRIDLDGPRSVPFPVFSPLVWAAVCELAGGRDRLETKTWTNYLIVNFRANADMTELRPAPHWDSWHLDEPRRDMRLDDLRAGPICIALLSEQRSGWGTTWIAPDSVAVVSRTLRDSPGGVDFVQRSSGPEIVSRCHDLVELTGDVGDVYLLHPLMAHSSSPNPSGRIRWSSQQMVYLTEPMRALRREESECSPLELAVRRACLTE